MITFPVKVKCQLIQTKHNLDFYTYICIMYVCSVSYGRVTNGCVENNNIHLLVCICKTDSPHSAKKKKKLVKRS